MYEARDGVCVPGGQVIASPRYYDKKLASWSLDQSFLVGYRQGQRQLRAESRTSEFASLESQERVAKARLRFYQNSKL